MDVKKLAEQHDKFMLNSFFPLVKQVEGLKAEITGLNRKIESQKKLNAKFIGRKGLDKRIKDILEAPTVKKPSLVEKIMDRLYGN